MGNRVSSLAGKAQGPHDALGRHPQGLVLLGGGIYAWQWVGGGFARGRG